MNEGGAGIRPETLALDALIKATIEPAGEGAVHPASDTMLFLGNRHASFPALVVQDPILEPVDKLAWMAIRLQARETGGNTALCVARAGLVDGPDPPSSAADPGP